MLFWRRCSLKNTQSRMRIAAVIAAYSAQVSTVRVRRSSAAVAVIKPRVGGIDGGVCKHLCYLSACWRSTQAVPSKLAYPGRSFYSYLCSVLNSAGTRQCVHLQVPFASVLPRSRGALLLKRNTFSGERQAAKLRASAACGWWICPSAAIVRCVKDMLLRPHCRTAAGQF